MNRSEKKSITLAISFPKAKLIEHSMPQANIKNSKNAGYNTRKPLAFKNPFSNQEKPTKVGNQAIILQLTLVIRTYGGLPGCHRNVGGNYSSIR